MSEAEVLFDGTGFEIFPAELQAILKVIDAEKMRISFESTSTLKIEAELELCRLPLEANMDLRGSAPDVAIGKTWNVPVKPVRRLLSALPADELHKEREFVINEYTHSKGKGDICYPDVMRLHLFFMDNSIGFDLCFDEFGGGEISLEVPAIREEIPKTLERDKLNKSADSKIDGFKVMVT